ncbi:hypothetical protein G6F63_014504 [Rhizopus arrhizus]|nr:hypothetical protein G6F63_014504 [Rhizopus arrhizus]
MQRPRWLCWHRRKAPAGAMTRWQTIPPPLLPARRENACPGTIPDLSPAREARCLAAIGRYAPLSVNDLARSANLNKGQASRSAQALVERGLVEKALSAAGGRGVVLTPTVAGVAQYQRIIALIAQRNDEIFACLDADEQRVLGDMLDRLIDHLQAREDGEPGEGA